MSTSSPVSSGLFADKLTMQHRLFAELSAMFGKEVPLYDKSLLVNKVCNRIVCDVLGKLHGGFAISDEQLDKSSGERHGAIRIGTPGEYRWIAGFFAAFAMEPHNFYDMTQLGGKSQPIIATAFRSILNPEHRVFTSLLMLPSISPEVRERVEKLLAGRQVFSDRAKELVMKNEAQGGLEPDEAEELIREGTTRIFKWTAQARDYKLYQELSSAGFKIAADIACFGSHHLNHLTPNTFCMDLYTSAMKFCMDELDRETFAKLATDALEWLRKVGDRDYMKLHFRHLSLDDIDAFEHGAVSDEDIVGYVSKLIEHLSKDELDLSKLNHSGFKDYTEGPDVATPVLLRQDSYKALTEPVTFTEPDGSKVEAVHTARFGEIEQRFYATTEKGRELYDRCLAEANAARDADPALLTSNYDVYLEKYSAAFEAFPETLGELLKAELVFGRYLPTQKGRDNAGQLTEHDIQSLVDQGYVQYEGLRYEDFLPFSAAGIFASNLGQYGTKSGTDDKPVYTQQTLEEIMGRRIVDPVAVTRGLQAESLLETYETLGLLDKLSDAERQALENAVATLRSIVGQETPVAS